MLRTISVFFSLTRRPPRYTPGVSSAASDVYTGKTIGLEQSAHCEFHENVHAHVNSLLLQGTNEFETGGIADVGQSWVGVTAEVALAGQPLRCPVEDCAPLLLPLIHI